MQYLISVIAEGRAPADEQEMAAIDVFNDGLRADGHWVFAGGVAAPDTAIVIDARGADAIVAHGPFVESDEYVAGFWVVDAANGEEAVRLATAGSRACNRKVEVRAFL